MGITVFTILVLSLLSIYGAYFIWKRIMPDSNQVWMTIEERHPDGEGATYNIRRKSKKITVNW